MTAISYKHKFIFLANKKCGSNTLHQLLRPHCCEFHDQGMWSKPVGRHDSALKVHKYMTGKGKDWNKYFVFTTIRNPFDRILSCYAFEKKRKMRSAKCDFDTYVRNRRYKHFVDIGPFTCESSGKVLVNQIIRLEDFDVEIPKLFVKLGLPTPQIQRRNTTNSGVFKKFMTPPLQKIILERHASDFEYYR